jgi:hypothetical protein
VRFHTRLLRRLTSAYLLSIFYSIGPWCIDCFHRSRTAWKHVRDAEADIVPRRTIRQNFKNEIGRVREIQASGRGGNLDTKLQQLETQLKKAEADDAPLEKELDLLRRAAIKESEAMKWKAFREVSGRVLAIGFANKLTGHC